MAGQQSEFSQRIALISMPWSIFNRPSLQLGTLKSYVETHSPYHVDCYHPYLSLAKTIGPQLYAEIARSGWAGEAIFAPLLFPEMHAGAYKLYSTTVGKKKSSAAAFDKLIVTVEKECAEWLQKKSLEDYFLIGFSVCFFQLLSSLYLATKIRESSHKTPIVFGGSSCFGNVGKSLFDTFTVLDYVVAGEGEESLLALCRYLAGETSALPPTVLSRTKTRPTPLAITPLDLETLPSPDYSAYFCELREQFGDQPFIPVLPIEFSRGCWWNRCAFCNLNMQWQSYRKKSGKKMVAEVNMLSKKHTCLQFAFADNALPPGEATSFFSTLRDSRCNYDFFAEIRANLSDKTIECYRNGGLRSIQVGIEALSPSLLERMVKGTTLIDNITMMKMAALYDIKLDGNLIVDFPGTTPSEINETLETLDYLLPFSPLQPAGFFLGYGSPMANRPQSFAITEKKTHPKYKNLIPQRYVNNLTTTCVGFRDDSGKQEKLWQPVRLKLLAWQKFYQDRQRSTSPLYYRKGDGFIIITQELLNGVILNHRLRGMSGEIYLFCDTAQPVKEIYKIFSTIPHATIDKFLLEMRGKRLMFADDDMVLSLAIPLH